MLLMKELPHNGWVAKTTRIAASAEYLTARTGLFCSCAWRKSVLLIWHPSLSFLTGQQTGRLERQKDKHD